MRLVWAGLVLAVALGSVGCASAPASSSAEACVSEVAASTGDPTRLGGTGVSVAVPDGWTAQLGSGDQTQSLVMSSADQRFLVRVTTVPADLADMLPAYEAQVVGERSVAIGGGRTIDAEMISSDGKSGYRVISAIPSGKAEIEVLGSAVGCPASMIDLLGRVSLGS